MDELVSDDDTRTWGDVARATRANEPWTITRQQTRLRSVGGASSSRSRHEVGLCSNSKEVHYGLRDDSDDNLEIEDMGDLSEGNESMDDDVLED